MLTKSRLTHVPIKNLVCYYLIYRDILEAQIRLDLVIFWSVVARSKNLIAQGLLGMKNHWRGLGPGQKKWARPNPQMIRPKMILHAGNLFLS